MSAIKICGLTTIEDAHLAAKLGATHLGLVFHKPSARCVGLKCARRLVHEIRLRGHPCQWIGVFVDQPVDQVRRVAAQIGLDGVQLHGSELAEVSQALLGDGLFVLRAFRVSQAPDPGAMAALPASAYLLDGYDPDQIGGTGRSFDWALASDLRLDRPLVLAGGLTPENVSSAVRIAHPWGVDVSSGVEIAPGKKDPKKLRCFIDAATSALQREENRNEPSI